MMTVSPKIVTLLQSANEKFNQKEYKAAEKLLEKVLKKDKLNPKALHISGLIARIDGRHARAEMLFQKVIKLLPGNSTPIVDLGIAFLEQKKFEQAERQFCKALKLTPNHFHAYSNLGIVYSKQDKIEDAILSYEAALKINPKFYVASFNLGKLYKTLKNYAQAEKYYRQALTLNPKYREARQALLFMLSFYQIGSTDLLYNESVNLNKLALPAREKSIYSHKTIAVPTKLRIGYMSPDFRNHAVSFFIKMILENHNKDRIEVFCYSQTRKEDVTTQEIKKSADKWITTFDLNDRQLADRIHQDKIDILVDLAGHTRGSRIDVCARRPAPIQATYLGYSSTTGVPGVDYWITDNVVHPNNCQEKTSETLYRLPRCWVAYKPNFPAEDIAPERKDGDVRFCSFNNLDKISDETLALWSDILAQLPNARLLLKAKQLNSPTLKALFVERCLEQGIKEVQLEFASFTQSYHEHMSLYNSVDIALDSFPTTGGTTTADALWMGVPVISLAGDRFMARMGASLIASANVPEYIAESKSQYVKKALNTAESILLNPNLKQEIHETVKMSPLFDGGHLTESLEDAYRTMWEKYISSNAT